VKIRQDQAKEPAPLPFEARRAAVGLGPGGAPPHMNLSQGRREAGGVP
jgi:hypothetical protein